MADEFTWIISTASTPPWAMRPPSQNTSCSACRQSSIPNQTAPSSPSIAAFFNSPRWQPDDLNITFLKSANELLHVCLAFRIRHCLIHILPFHDQRVLGHYFQEH